MWSIACATIINASVSMTFIITYNDIKHVLHAVIINASKLQFDTWYLTYDANRLFWAKIYLDNSQNLNVTLSITLYLQNTLSTSFAVVIMILRTKLNYHRILQPFNMGVKWGSRRFWKQKEKTNRSYQSDIAMTVSHIYVVVAFCYSKKDRETPWPWPMTHEP